MTLNDLVWPFYVEFCFCAGTTRFLREFLKAIALNNKGRPIFSAAKVFSVDSSFWRYKVYADIRGSSQIFM